MEVYFSDNPYLNNNIPVNVLSDYDHLNKMNFPIIKTLIYSTTKKNINIIAKTDKIEHKYYAKPEEENMEVFPEESSMYGEIQTYNQKNLPQNIEEVYKNLQYIRHERSGRKSTSSIGVYKVEELKSIAKNLLLSTAGKKEDIVKRIRDYVLKFYNKTE